MRVSLAIVIPAYKRYFFYEALESLANQTDKRFRVYIGDDASPENLKSVVDQFKNQIDIVYHRFEDNLGATSLIQHWNRCVRLSSEPWVWLFSDDDVASNNCVESFYKRIDETDRKYELYSFTLHRMDDNGRLSFYNMPLPTTMMPIEFLYYKTSMNFLSCAPEHVFSRRIFENSSGFVDFPAAWFSDDATWMLFSKKSGICGIPEATVFWRKGKRNISVRTEFNVHKFEASILFLKWFDSFMENYSMNANEEKIWENCFQKSFINRMIKLVAELDFVLFAKHKQRFCKSISCLFSEEVSINIIYKKFIFYKLKSFIKNKIKSIAIYAK